MDPQIPVEVFLDVGVDRNLTLNDTLFYESPASANKDQIVLSAPVSKFHFTNYLYVMCFISMIFINICLFSSVFESFL